MGSNPRQIFNRSRLVRWAQIQEEVGMTKQIFYMDLLTDAFGYNFFVVG